MATTIVAADAVVTLGVTLSLGGKTFDIEYSKTLSSVTVADRRVVNVPTSEIDLITLTAAVVGKGQFSSFDGFFIMNRDDTNFVRLRVREAGGDTSDFRLDPGEWMCFWNSKMEVNTTAAAFGAFIDWDTIAVQADTASVDLEYLAVKI